MADSLACQVILLVHTTPKPAWKIEIWVSTSPFPESTWSFWDPRTNSEVIGDRCIPSAWGHLVKKRVGMAILRKQLWVSTGRGGVPGETMEYLCPSALSPSTFWVSLALLCSPDQPAAWQINGANALDKNRILASVMIQFPRFLMLSVISRLQVFRTKQVDEYDISVKMSVSAPCCIVAVTDMHFCHKKSYRNRQVMLTGQYIYFVGKANSAKKNGPAISLNLSDYTDSLVSLWITVYRSSLNHLISAGTVLF